MVAGTAIPAAADSAEEYPVVRLAYSHMFATDSEQAIEDAMNEILRETVHAEVDLVGVDFGALQTQMNLMLTGGKDAVDIFSSFWYMPLATLYANGQLAPLDELLEETPEVLELFEEYPEVMDCCRIDGQLYALPTVAPYSSPMLYIVRKTDSDSAEIDWSEIHTLDDVTQAMLKMKEANPTHYYVPAASETYWVPKDIDYLGDTNFLGVLTDPTNSTTVENYYESDYFMNFLDNVKVWQENEILSPDSMSNSNPTLMSVQVGITEGTPGYGWDIDEWLYEANLQHQYGDDMTGCVIGDRLITTGNVGTYLWHITSFSQNKEAAMKVLAAFYTDERIANLYANGIEGENYVVNEDGTLSFPEGKDMTNCGWIGLGSTYSCPNSSLCPVWYYQPLDMWDMMEKTNEEAIPSLALGFTFDASEVADQITACSNVIAQYYLPIINGEVDIDEILPLFQQELKSAGIDDIIAEKQAQLDAWLEAKEAEAE
jgi:putative aldouronate transport system substrate-binding protein